MPAGWSRLLEAFESAARAAQQQRAAGRRQHIRGATVPVLRVACTHACVPLSDADVIGRAARSRYPTENWPLVQSRSLLRARQHRRSCLHLDGAAGCVVASTLAMRIQPAVRVPGSLFSSTVHPAAVATARLSSTPTMRPWSILTTRSHRSNISARWATISTVLPPKAPL